jgi:hypothetical protein
VRHLWHCPQQGDLTCTIRYLCAQCNNLQDATRYTDLRKLPPVLHFSLLRFVYDVASMERQKSKHSISFPASIDMNRFMGNATERAKAASGVPGTENIYDLRGVLLHKGTACLFWRSSQLTICRYQRVSWSLRSTGLRHHVCSCRKCLCLSSQSQQSASLVSVQR